jgi:hypothetical protein
MAKKHYRLWNAVRNIIRKHYNLLKDEYLRDAYYIVGDLIAPLIGTEITQDDYNWLLTKQGYASLRDDIWPSLEQKEGLERPKAWPSGMVIDHGQEKLLSKVEEDMELGLTYIWDQARGFIFVEKGGIAKKIKVLSEYGWTILAGKGYPERLMRKLLKEEEKQRPVLAFHDFDPDGLGIYRALGYETRRTKHLDIALGDRVSDLGLTEEHVTTLNLPRRPSPPKYKGKPRVEISALAVLKTRMGIENPILAYTVAAMIAKGLTISPTEIDKMEMMKRHIRWALTDGLSSIVEAAVEEITEELEDEEKYQGTAVRGEAEDLEIIAPGLKDKLVESGLNLAEKTNFVNEKDLDKEARELTDEKLIELLTEDKKK